MINNISWLSKEKVITICVIILLVFFLTLCYFLIIRASATNIKGGRPTDYKTHRCFGEDGQLYQVIGSTCTPITFGGNDSYIFVLNDEGINKLTGEVFII